MAIEQTQRPIESSEPFPAHENSTYPPKSTVRFIVGFTFVLVLMVCLFGLASQHPGHQADVPTPASQQQASPPGAHDQQ